MHNRAYFFILLTLMIDAMGIGLVFPIMPDLMTRVGAGGTGEGALWAGVLMASYAGALFLFAPIIGSSSDAYGRKPILLLALAVLAVDYVIMALATEYWVLLIGRIFAGIAGATYTTATAFIADISTAKERSARFGMIGAAFGIGFVLGPAIGGIAAEWHITAPFWIAAVLSAGNVVFGLIVLPESLAREKRRPFGLRDLNPFSAIYVAFRVPGLAVPLICLFVFEFANMVYPTLWAFFYPRIVRLVDPADRRVTGGVWRVAGRRSGGASAIVYSTVWRISYAPAWYRIRLDRLHRIWRYFDSSRAGAGADLCRFVGSITANNNGDDIECDAGRQTGFGSRGHRLARVHCGVLGTAFHDRLVQCFCRRHWPVFTRRTFPDQWRPDVGNDPVVRAVTRLGAILIIVVLKFAAIRGYDLR